MQQNDEKAYINFDFYYNNSYSDYFKDYLQNINGEVNSNLDLLTNRNTKYLFYQFNDTLLNGNTDLIKIKHSEKIKDEVAISEIEKSDWQYFITRLFEIVVNILNEDDEFSQDEIKSIQTYTKNLIQIKNTYKQFYATLSSVFTSIIKNLPPEEKDEIQRELMNNNLGRLDFTSNLEDSSFLDKFVQFYFETGRFPCNTRLIILPRTTLPEEIKNTKSIKLRILFEIFQMTVLKALVSLQALCALLLHLSDNTEAKDAVHSTMSEVFENLTSASLNENNVSREAKFTALKKLSVLQYRNFEAVNLKSISKAQNIAFKLKTELNKYKKDITPVKAKIVDVNEYGLPIPGPLPSNETIKDEKVERNLRNCSCKSKTKS